MRDRTTTNDSDEGKPVRNADGEKVGQVMAVEHGRAYVEPEPGLTDSIRAKLGWGETTEDTYELTSNSIATITEEEIRLEE
jgi:hypothetical protein